MRFDWKSQRYFALDRTLTIWRRGSGMFQSRLCLKGFWFWMSIWCWPRNGHSFGQKTSILLPPLYWRTSRNTWASARPFEKCNQGIPHIQYTFPATPLFSLSITLFRRGLSKKLLHNNAPLQEKWPAAKAAGHVPILRTHVVHLPCEVCCMQTKYYVKDSELNRRNATGGE